jgi:hypothetical protein
MNAVPADSNPRSVLLSGALALVLGLLLAGVAVALSGQPAPASLLGLIGGALVSGAAEALALTLRVPAGPKAVAQVESAPPPGHADTTSTTSTTSELDPGHAGQLAAYRWDCHLACPLPHDEHPDHAYQSMRVCYRVDALASTLQLACAASRDDRALERFRADDFIFRWLVDDDLDPADPMIFAVGTVRVDEHQLTAGPASVIDVIGGAACLHSYQVPRRLRSATGHQVEFQVLVRKFIGRETRLRIQAQLFRQATDAEYRLSVDPDLNVTGLHPSAAEMRAVGAAGRASIGAIYPPPFDQRAAVLHLPFRLRPGSVAAFGVDRDPTVHVR